MKGLGSLTLYNALRWVNEFNVSNRPKGNPLELSVNATFQ
jgi:hypothetical protein